MDKDKNKNNDDDLSSSSMFDVPQEETENMTSMFDGNIEETSAEEKIKETAAQETELPSMFEETTPQNFAAADLTEEKVDNISIPNEETPEVPIQIIDDSDNNDDIKEENPTDIVTVRPVKFKKFEAAPPNRAIKKNLDIMQDISMHISVELGRTKLSIKEVMDLEKESVVELNKIAGEQVEIFVNGKLVAKGEVIVIEDKFGVRITSTNIGKNTPIP